MPHHTPFAKQKGMTREETTYIIHVGECPSPWTIRGDREPGLTGKGYVHKEELSPGIGAPKRERVIKNRERKPFSRAKIDRTFFSQASPYKGNGKKEIRKRRSVQKSARMLGFRATLRASLPQQARFIPAGPETEDEFPLATRNELARCPSESTDSPPAPASIR